MICKYLCRLAEPMHKVNASFDTPAQTWFFRGCISFDHSTQVQLIGVDLREHVQTDQGGCMMPSKPLGLSRLGRSCLGQVPGLWDLHGNYSNDLLYHDVPRVW